MTIQDIISSVFTVVIIPVLIVLTKYITNWIAVKAEELKEKAKTELDYKYLSLLQDTITKCVLQTQQTYVDSLKKQGKFDLEAQKKAFQDTYDAIYHLLSDEALMYLSELLPDLSKYITSSIESQIYLNK